jgi:hypothetical protein
MPAAMRTAAATLLRNLDDLQLSKARIAFSDEKMRRWIEYRPQPRPGACVAELSIAGRKAAHQLLATALSPHAFAQAMTIVALEEVLDSAEEGRRGRHSGDYWVAVFGDPLRDEQWGWRFEGHHLSVTMTLTGDLIAPTPVFLGANPARTEYAGHAVVRPLAPEEDLARALLDALTPAQRADAIVASAPPPDIRSAQSPRAAAITPTGIASSQLDRPARDLLDQLTHLYLDRLPASLAAAEAERLHGTELHFAWEGGSQPRTGHYYRVQGTDLLIEYDNTANNANHAHTVLRRPLSDFGGDVLTAHRATTPHGSLH